MGNLKLKTQGAVNGSKVKEAAYASGSPGLVFKEKSNGVRKKKSVSDIDPSENFNSKQLLKVLMEVKNGNFAVRMPIDEIGLNGKICDTLNDIITLNERMMLEFTKAG
ncbi:MAG TPA: hypothetical protein VK489_14015, partial [Ferruginibacter sp.]|nr:hypothetical protein [Ferruginibacter sp.]